MVDQNKRIEKVINLYNEISDKKLDYQDFCIILPKLTLILKYNSLDNIEIIDLIDTLIDFKKKSQLDKINIETIKLMKKMVKNEAFDLEDSLYFSINLRHLLLPYNINNCDNEENELYHISKMELVLEMINKSFSMEDYNILNKYNSELTTIALYYKKTMELYDKKISSEIILNTIISHLYSIFYFNKDAYNSDYIKLELITRNAIQNYQEFINYCYNEGICENFTKLFLEKEELENEYKVCKKILDYTCINKEKGMSK